MRCQSAGFSWEKLEREVRDLLVTHSNLILHDLYCVRCGHQARAWALLTLAGWATDDLMRESGRGV